MRRMLKPNKFMSAPISNIREPLITGSKTYHQITEDLIGPTEKVPGFAWIAGVMTSLALLAFGGVAIFWTIWYGIGSWDLNRTIGWGWDITNFVWWIGIGHAGTLISAILLLFRHKWRMGVNRSAEAMTIFAVMCAALFPGIHMGRIWMAMFIFPYPNTRGPLWVNFNSPLLWDVFAISTYFTVSLLFWYTGLVPDFATVRDRAKGFRKKIYSFLAFGWTGKAKHWQRWESLSLILAGIATPLVLSVHTIVSFDFATSVIPGWHTTIFPPYFVAGAIFSGFAMVLTLMLIVRKVLKIEDYITIGHIESMNKVILCTGSIVGVAYLTELFIAWYSGYVYEQFAFYNRALGPYWWSYFGMMSCNVITPQFFWIKKIRRSVAWTFVLSIVVNIGMWFERFVIIATTLARDYLPSSWSYYVPTWVEVGIYVGTFGLFFTLFLLFLRVAPVVAAAEIKSILKTAGDQYTGPNATHHAHHDDHGHDDKHEDLKLPADSNSFMDSNRNVATAPIVEKTKRTNTQEETTSYQKIEDDPEVYKGKEIDTNLDPDDPNYKSSFVAGAVGAGAGLTSLGTHEDDLKKVEGIGPAVEKLLKEGGVKNWKTLAAANPEQLKELLVEAGGTFKTMDPTTWPLQAQMADEGRWAELEKWQDDLDGGKIS